MGIDEVRGILCACVAIAKSKRTENRAAEWSSMRNIWYSLKRNVDQRLRSGGHNNNRSYWGRKNREGNAIPSPEKIRYRLELEFKSKSQPQIEREIEGSRLQEVRVWRIHTS